MKSLKEIKHYTVARNFHKATTLKRAIDRLGYLQADPIRSPARAQDLILNQRVKDYRAGDLERLYSKLEIEEDFFVNYGYVTDQLHNLMHPRANATRPTEEVGGPWFFAKRKQAEQVLAFVKERGPVHPKQVDEFFAHGKVTNFWGGSSNFTTHLLDAMHYVGMVRVTHREKGIRLYAAKHAELLLDVDDPELRDSRLDALADVVVNLYGPFPGASLSSYLRRLRYATPQWQQHLAATVERTKARLSKSRIDGIDWYWAESSKLFPRYQNERVRFLAPFDPVVHDRRRFEILWGWEYRFEAYTPAVKRKLGYYAMPMLWRDDVIGWANLSVKNGKLVTEFGYVEKAPRDPVFKRELEAEIEQMRTFLGLQIKKSTIKNQK